MTLDLVLEGQQVRLEPLQLHHAGALLAALSSEPSLYQWTPVPHSQAEAVTYINTALSWKEAGTAVPFAIVRKQDGTVIGSTRFWNVERWAWPAEHRAHAGGFADACEIGYTWLAHSAIRSRANTESKLLMLQHAFEEWKMLRVCFHTDSRNQRSRAALERIGAKFEGILRAHRMAVDYIPRDSARYSIIASEWPEVKKRLTARLNRG